MKLFRTKSIDVDVVKDCQYFVPNLSVLVVVDGQLNSLWALVQLQTSGFNDLQTSGFNDLGLQRCGLIDPDLCA